MQQQQERLATAAVLDAQGAVMPGALDINKTWALNVTTMDGGLANKPKYFTVKPMPLPAFGSIVPVSGAQGTTVPFTINGNNFQVKKGLCEIVVRHDDGQSDCTRQTQYYSPSGFSVRLRTPRRAASRMACRRATASGTSSLTTTWS